jgi:hypothetical protein
LKLFKLFFIEALYIAREMRAKRGATARFFLDSPVLILDDVGKALASPSQPRKPVKLGFLQLASQRRLSCES